MSIQTEPTLSGERPNPQASIPSLEAKFATPTMSPRTRSGPGEAHGVWKTGNRNAIAIETVMALLLRSAQSSRGAGGEGDPDLGSRRPGPKARGRLRVRPPRPHVQGRQPRGAPAADVPPARA